MKDQRPRDLKPKLLTSVLVILSISHVIQSVKKKKNPISKGVQQDRYIVASVDGEWCNVRTLTEAQLRSMSYRMKLNQCYLVPCYQHIASKNVTFEDGLEDTCSAEQQYQLHPSRTPTISPSHLAV